MKIYRYLLAVMLSLLTVFSLLPACGEPDQQANAHQEETRVLDKEAFAAAIRRSNAVVIDVRTPAEYEQGHIENAINLNFFDPEFKHKLLELNKRKSYYLYCKNEVRSYRAMEFMKTNEFPQVYILKEGWTGWNTAKAETPK